MSPGGAGLGQRVRVARRAAAWRLKGRLDERTVSRLRAGLAAADRVTLPVVRRRVGEARPIPPRELRMRIGAVDPVAFLEQGHRSAEQVLEAFAHAGVDLRAADRVLDFGCGCGRVARHLAPLVRPGGYHGVDVDAEAVAWLARHLPEGEFATNRFVPPLPFPDGYFDAVFSISVFTHLTEAAQQAWLQEVRRVLAPGGMAALSIHGHAASTRTWWGQGLTESAAMEINRRGPRIEEEGYFFVPYDDLGSTEKYAGIADAYGNAFQSHAWTRERWGAVLEVADILPASVVGYQDFVIARR